MDNRPREYNLAPPAIAPRYVIPNLAFPDWDNTALHTGMPCLLTALISCLQPRVVVEAGTYKGHGAIAMASVLRDIKCGHLWTADPVDHTVTKLLREASLDAYATYHMGDFEEMLENLIPKGDVIDLAFIDASGSSQDAFMRVRHFLRAMDRLAPHGIVVMDDIAATDWPMVNVLRGMAHIYFPGLRGIALFQKR